jgi:hypothetical protein
MREIVTRAVLPFSPDEVWSALIDFSAYRDWNPLNVGADGDPAPGARVRMTFIDPGHPGRTITQYVKVIAAEAPTRLAWVGSVPVLFRGEHYFELSGDGDVTEMRHGERLSGLLPRLWGPRRIEQQRLAYEAMNQSLVNRLKFLFGNAPEQRQQGGQQREEIPGSDAAQHLSQLH